MGKRKADADPSAVSWTAPTDEEFAELKRYKSFLLPPNNSYALGQFVWLAHDLTKPRKPIKQPRQSASSSAPTTPAKKNGADPKSELDHVEDALVKGQKKPGKYVRTEQDEEDDEKWDAAFWLGQIIEIRANGTSYVWMKIRWMCRKISELREQNIKSGLPKSHPGGREVFMLGPEFDALQPVGAVEGAARVVLFDERNPFQTPMDEKTIFYRSEARTPTGAELYKLKLKKPAQEKSKKPRPSELVPTGHLFPLREPTCYCGEAYRPILRPAPMAMCVNEGCYKWFHLGCLDWGKDYRIEATPGLLELIQTSGCELAEKFLSSYDDVAPVQLPDGVKLGELVDTMSVNGQSPRPVPKAPAPEELSALTDTPNLPLSIIRAAQSAVIRGSGETGIVGNARKVLRAREILKKSRGLVDVTKLVEEWLKIWVGDEALKEVEVNQTIEVKSGRKSVTFYDNAKANGATVAELGKEDGDDTPDLAGSQDIPARTVVWLCPSCKHPI